MRIVLIFHLALIIATLNPMGLSSSLAQPAKDLTLSSSRGAAGRDYPTAGSIAKAVNLKCKEYGFRITVQSRRSSVPVLNKVISGEIYFGEVQQNRIYQAQKGLADWIGRPQKDLCSVINTHAAYITLIASVDSGIRTIRDLEDMRVGVGRPGSDLYDNAVDILAAVGINYKSDLSVVDDSLEAVPDLLQGGDLDAFFWPVGKLSRPMVDLLSGTKKVHMVAIAAPGIDALIAANPFYEKATVPMTLYPGIDDHGGVEALGVKMRIVTSCGMPDKTVYTIAKESFENFGSFEKKYPKASMMTKKAMIDGLPAPVHPGAMKYYKESGMDPMLRP